uniref:O-methyltransferase domain-containing protein n=1 Tax=Oryza brachyantha TaxID=4533 RepID=J3MRW6_ORYBR
MVTCGIVSIRGLHGKVNGDSNFHGEGSTDHTHGSLLLQLRVSASTYRALDLTFSYLKATALECAVKLGIPNTIHRCGGAASLSELVSSIPVPESRKPHLPRLMRFLTAVGIFSLDMSTTEEEITQKVTCMYRLTPLSRLLVDNSISGHGSLFPFVLSQTTKYHVSAAMHLSEWFMTEDKEVAIEMPFRAAHGTDLWGVMARDANMNEVFNAGMGSDSRLAIDYIINKCGEVFDGISSLVDVGGGTGTSARAIAKAFPHIKCSVLGLPNVIDTITVDGIVEYIAGNMMEQIPPTDAVLLKYILHDWNDEDCVKILKQCRNAIYSQKSGGKVIIIDIVVGSSLKSMFEAQVSFDLLMMVITSGKERDKHEWHKIFIDAGFTQYKTRPVLGFLSIIELYP